MANSEDLTSNVLAYVSEVAGADFDLNDLYASGVVVMTDIGNQSGTEPDPTTAPTDEPTAPPQDGGNNAPTFDLGLGAMAAVALSGVTAVRRKKKS